MVKTLELPPLINVSYVENFCLSSEPNKRSNSGGLNVDWAEYMSFVLTGVFRIRGDFLKLILYLV